MSEELFHCYFFSDQISLLSVSFLKLRKGDSFAFVAGEGNEPLAPVAIAILADIVPSFLPTCMESVVAKSS